MSETNIQQKSYAFALDIVNFIRLLPKDVVGYAFAKQLIRSGTSIGANVEEAQGASSKKDFINKINIAKKEARETKYWLRLILDSGIVAKNKAVELLDKCSSLINILTAIVKTAESKNNNEI